MNFFIYSERGGLGVALFLSLYPGFFVKTTIGNRNGSGLFLVFFSCVHSSAFDFLYFILCLMIILYRFEKKLLF